MTNLKKSIAAKLYRAECPDPLLLGEYQLRMLPAGQARQVQAHLKECPLCARELETLRAYLETLAVDSQPGLSRRIQTWVARLLPDLSTGAAPGLAFAMRGEENPVRVYQAGDAQLHLEIQPDPQQPDRRALLGLLIGVAAQDVQVVLLQGARQVGAAALDELGNFILPAIAPGVYSFLLRGPSFEIVIETLEVPA